MKITIRIQRRSSAPAQDVETLRSVWMPTEQTFLSTLVGCTREQTEPEELQPEDVASQAAALAAELAAHLASCEESAEETVLPESPAAEQTSPIAAPWMDADTSETLETPQTPEIPLLTSLLCTWTFQQPISTASMGASIPVAAAEESPLSAADTCISAKESLGLTIDQPTAVLEEIQAVEWPAVTVPENVASVLQEPALEMPEQPAATAMEEPAAEMLEQSLAPVSQEPAVEIHQELAAAAVEEPASAAIENAVASVLQEPALEMPEQPAATAMEEPAAEVLEQVSAPVSQEPAVEIHQELAAAAVEEPVSAVVENAMASVVQEPVLEIPEKPAATAVEEQVSAVAEPVEHAAAIARIEEPVREEAAVEPQRMRPVIMPSKPKGSEAPAAGMLLRTWRWLNGKHSETARKQLRVAETISLGEKRFVAVVHVDGQKFLIGGGSSGVSLLTSLGNQDEARETASALATFGGNLA